MRDCSAATENDVCRPPAGRTQFEGEGEINFLRQLFDLAEAVNDEGDFLPASDRLVGHDLSGCHFADLRISGCLERNPLSPAISRFTISLKRST
jgi:hypothetical protein